MSARLCVTVASLSLAISACVSFNKQCFGDGVCRTEKDGQVTWEGPPEKVAEYQAREEAQKKAAAARDAAFASAPRRAPTEPIRVAILGPTGISPGAEPFSLQYRQMFLEAMQGDPRLVLVDAGRVAHLLKGSAGYAGGRANVPVAVDAAMSKRVRDGSEEVDVLVVVTARDKQRTGLVSGNGGVGAVQVVNIEFVASVSSVYDFAEQQSATVGESTAGLAVGGYDKSGKHKQGELKAMRDPSRDRGALGQLAAWVKGTVTGPVGAGLPSLAAVQSINQELKTQQANQLLQLLQKKP
jgi:hypothetical protein